MQFLTHSTVVSPLTRIRRKRLLPGPGELVAKVGQEVSQVQVLARAPLQMEFEVVPVSKMLRISPEELAENLLVGRGTIVEQGMPLVKKRGLGRKEFVSPVDGMLYDVVNGRLVFQRTSGFVELRALARGRVVSRIANRGVELEINGSRIQAVWDSGKETFGTIHVVAQTAVSPLANQPMDTEIGKRILVTGKITELEALEQAERAGVSGLITGSMAAHLLEAAASFSFPIFVTDGIGDQGMAEPTFALLRESEAREAALFTSPPHEPGIRPEIVIPLEAVPGEEPPLAGRPLALGQTVRILRAPFSNQMGVVSHLYRHTRATAVGGRAYGADVTLSNGQVVFIPIANLDTIV
jgi:hypothetical protein